MISLSGDDLQICPAGFSCCTRDMEMQLAGHSRQKYDERLMDATDSAKRHLVAATTQLHGKFVDPPGVHCLSAMLFQLDLTTTAHLLPLRRYGTCFLISVTDKFSLPATYSQTLSD